jgi:hypothetical protein
MTVLGGDQVDGQIAQGAGCDAQIGGLDRADLVPVAGADVLVVEVETDTRCHYSRTGEGAALLTRFMPISSRT